MPVIDRETFVRHWQMGLLQSDRCDERLKSTGFIAGDYDEQNSTERIQTRS